MKLLKTRLRVRAWINREDFEGRQDLCKEWSLWGFVVWQEILDSEVVPSWSNICRATLGYTEWKSKFHDITEAWDV